MDTGTKLKPRAKVAHTYGAKDIANWNFEENKLPDAWAAHTSKGLRVTELPTLQLCKSKKRKAL